MTDAEKIAVLLSRKQEIDALDKDRYIETQRWLVGGVELLLLSMTELRKELNELQARLQAHGITR